MTFWRWLRSAAVGAALCAAPAMVAAQGVPATMPNIAQLGTDELQSVLLSRGSTRGEREQAARQLVQRRQRGSDASQVNRILTDVLNDNSERNHDPQLAVVRALKSDPNPNREFIDPLCNIFTGNVADKTEAAAEALAAYNGQYGTLDRLNYFATNEKLPVRPQRTAIIRAMGHIASKQAARMLVEGFIMPRYVNTLLRDNACDALSEITGETTNGLDAQKWTDWWNQNQARTDAGFEHDALLRKAAGGAAVTWQYRALCEAVPGLLRETYDAAPDKEKTVLGWLNAPRFEVRAAAVQLVYNLWTEGFRPTPPIIAQIVSMLAADGSAEVRRQVALALQVLPDKEALPKLRSQLAAEDDADVRGAIALALASTRDPSVIDDLVGLLDDKTYRVGQSAAKAIQVLLRDMAAANVVLDEAKRAHISQALRGRADAVATKLTASSLREACFQAMAQLADPTLLSEFLKVLNEREDPRIQIAALQGLGRLGKKESAPYVVRSLESHDDGVRLEAAKALASTVSSADVRALFEHLFGRTPEKDETIASKIDPVIRSLIPTGTDDELVEWTGLFALPAKPDGRAQYLLDVYKERERRLQQAAALLPLADVRSEAGKLQMRLGSYEEAGIEFDQALADLKGVRGVRPALLDDLHQSSVEAWLHTENIDRAYRAADEAIQFDGQLTVLVWSELQKAVARQMDARKPEAARTIINRFMELQKLNGAYGQQMRKLLDGVRAATTGQTWLLDAIWPEFAATHRPVSERLSISTV